MKKLVVVSLAMLFLIGIIAAAPDAEANGCRNRAGYNACVSQALTVYSKAVSPTECGYIGIICDTYPEESTETCPTRTWSCPCDPGSYITRYCEDDLIPDATKLAWYLDEVDRCHAVYCSTM